MQTEFPEGWGSLRFLWVRRELLQYLDEIIDPDQTAAWLRSNPNGLIVGIDQTFHFLFDDHDFGRGDIGISLFDAGEVDAIGALKDTLGAILKTNRDGDDAYFLSHPLWPEVVRAAGIARHLLASRGVPPPRAQ